MQDIVEYDCEQTVLISVFFQQSLFPFLVSSTRITRNDAGFSGTIVTLLLEWFLWF